MKFKLLVLVVFATLISSQSFAKGGNGAGNGGITLVCRDENGRIQSADLLDLVEGQKMDGLHYDRATTGSWSERLGQASQNLVSKTSRFEITPFTFTNRSYHGAMSMTVREVDGFELPDPKDFSPRMNPKNPKCRFEVLGLYDDKEKVLRVDQEILGALDELNRAAFYMHEILYRYARKEAQVEDSNSVRKLVAALFSNEGVSEELLMDSRSGGMSKVCFTTGQPELNSKRHWDVLNAPNQTVLHESLLFKVKFSNVSQAQTSFTVFTAVGDKFVGEGVLQSGIHLMVDDKTRVRLRHPSANPNIVSKFDELQAVDVSLSCGLSMFNYYEP